MFIVKRHETIILLPRVTVCDFSVTIYLFIYLFIFSPNSHVLLDIPTVRDSLSGFAVAIWRKQRKCTEFTLREFLLG